MECVEGVESGGCEEWSVWRVEGVEGGVCVWRVGSVAKMSTLIPT